jgi:hypothetical protein
MAGGCITSGGNPCKSRYDTVGTYNSHLHHTGSPGPPKSRGQDRIKCLVCSLNQENNSESNEEVAKARGHADGDVGQTQEVEERFHTASPRRA